MKNTIQLLAFFLCVTAYSQTTGNGSKVYSDYLKAIEADNLDSTSNIMTVYKGSSPMGEITIEKTTSNDQIIEKWNLAGNVLFHIVASKDQCYQVSNGEKKLLPDTMCNDFKPFIALFSELSLKDLNNTEVTEMETDGEKCYSVLLPGASTSHKFIYSQETGLKLKETQITKSGDKVAESSISYKNYEEHNGVKFPSIQVHSNFLQTGMAVEFELVEVKFDVPETKD